MSAEIRKELSKHAPTGKRICDIFAGSGVVATDLATNWNVLASDIQEYSRVLCSAMLLNDKPKQKVWGNFLNEALHSEFLLDLKDSINPLTTEEERSLDAAQSDSLSELSDIVEARPIIAFIKGEVAESSPLRNEMQHAIDRLRSIALDTGPETVISRYYGGLYFSWTQAAEIDALLKHVHEHTDENRDFLLAGILATASSIVNTVGKHFAQPIKIRDGSGKIKKHLIKQIIRDRRLSVAKIFCQSMELLTSIRDTDYQHQAVRMDFRDLLNNKNLHFDCVYADPPYTRDHYSRFYHVLETMALHDEPEISTTTIRSGGVPMLSRGMYRKERHQSPFSIRSQAPEAFEQLFLGVSQRNVPLVLSYSPFESAAGNRPRLLTVSQLEDLAFQYFANVKIITVQGSSHNKFNVTARNSVVAVDAEILLSATP